MADFEISSDPGRLDVDVIHAFLTRSYWAEGIPRQAVEKCIAGSICFGVYGDAGQVGFARVVTDRATFGYLADVFILDEFRGRGLSKRLMNAVMAHPDLQGLRRLTLVTRDAHSLYERYGFKPLAHPERHMEIHRSDIYQDAR